jgi:cytochrome P450/NADPH-cytochrome P450 reductase
LRHAHGEPAGPALLFFGCDHPDVDLLYRDELESALAACGPTERR